MINNSNPFYLIIVPVSIIFGVLAIVKLISKFYHNNSYYDKDSKYYDLDENLHLKNTNIKRTYYPINKNRRDTTLPTNINSNVTSPSVQITRLQNSMNTANFCPSCGQQVNFEDIFCAYCGKKLN